MLFRNGMRATYFVCHGLIQRSVVLLKQEFPLALFGFAAVPYTNMLAFE